MKDMHPSSINSRRSTLEHIMIKLLEPKDKEKIWKAAKEKLGKNKTKQKLVPLH